jgi:hypothetical protein
VRALYRSEPQLAHAIVDLGPQLTHILEGLLTGYLAGKPGASERALGKDIDSSSK